MRATHLPRFHEVAGFLERTVAPTSLPVTLTEVKGELRLGTITDDDDRLLNELIPAAVEQVETDTRRSLMPQTWVLRLDRFPDVIQLRRPPIVSVTSIKYFDVDGIEQTLNASVYQLDAKTEPGRVCRAVGESWPDTERRKNAIAVTFTAGYANAGVVPQLAKQAIKVAVRGMYYGCEETAFYESLIARLKWGGYV